MFATLSAIPFIGPFIAIIVAFFLAFPFWLFWTVWGYGSHFFHNILPNQFIDMSLWQTIMLFIILSFIKMVLLPSSIEIKN